MYEFGWSDNQFDQLCMGACAGHLAGCPAQCTGGLFSDSHDVQKWDNMGHPILEVSSGGSFTVTKPPDTDGAVTVSSVAQQLMYRVFDPGAFQCPDVTCDFTEIKLEDIGEDTVRVSGGRGLPPIHTYKVSCTMPDGYASTSLFLFVGEDATSKASHAHKAILSRTRRTLERMQLDDFDKTAFEVLGSGNLFSEDSASSTEVVSKIGLKHQDPRAIGIYDREAECCGLMV